MRLFDSSPRPGWMRKIGRQIFPACCAMSLLTALAPQMHAGFVGYYSFDNFLLVNTNGDGTASTPDAGLSVILMGGNNGSGLPGTTDLTIVSAAIGTLHFDYAYSSVDGVGFDRAGYLLGQTFVEFPDTDGLSGSTAIVVGLGQTVGFRVETMDNTGEPGILTITNFSAPGTAAQIPEPAALWTVTIGLAMVGVGQFMKRRRRNCSPGAEENQ
jgi:hypothetical protein